MAKVSGLHFGCGETLKPSRYRVVEKSTAISSSQTVKQGNDTPSQVNKAHVKASAR